MDKVRILAGADFHLGRRLSFPEGIEGEELSVKSGFFRFIDYAVEKENQIQAVVLAGDIVDSERDVFSAFSILEMGLGRLLKNKVELIVVAGNHDFLVLEKLKKVLPYPNFHLLGSGGKWESVCLTLNGQKIRFDGFSFPIQNFTKNPFEFYNLPEVGKEIAIGILHCDLKQPASSYAPVRMMDFLKLRHRAWILGHVHRHEMFSEDPLLFYAGSLTGLDPGEIGVHGAFSLEVSIASIEKKLVLPSFLEYCHVVIDLGGVEKEFFHERIMEEFSKLKGSRVYSVKLFLEGACSYYAGLDLMCQEIKSEIFELDGRKIFINSIENRAKSKMDLSAFCHGEDPVAQMARYLLEISQNNNSSKTIAKIRKALMSDKYLKEELLEFSDEVIREALLKSGYLVLEKMVEKK